MGRAFNQAPNSEVATALRRVEAWRLEGLSKMKLKVASNFGASQTLWCLDNGANGGREAWSCVQMDSADSMLGSRVVRR